MLIVTYKCIIMQTFVVCLKIIISIIINIIPINTPLDKR